MILRTELDNVDIFFYLCIVGVVPDRIVITGGLMVESGRGCPLSFFKAV
jgi:hypothetical protein